MKKIDIFRKLRTSGLRPTKQRVEIAKFLFEREKTFHFTVESLNKLLTKKSTSKIALATIYNTVHAFKTAGHLSEVEVRGNKTYFDTNVSNHHHFYDSETSELIDIDAKEIVIQKIRQFKNLLRSRIDPFDLEAFHRVSSQVNEIIEEGDVFKI